MENKKSFYAKLALSSFFAIIVFAMYFYVIFNKGDLQYGNARNILSFGCIGVCFIFSFLFIRKNAKKLLVTLALAVNVAADYFLVLMPSTENYLIGVCIFCGVQFCYIVYTLTLAKGKGLIIANIALRVALCLLAYFILPRYVLLSTRDLIAVMYIINCAVTVLSLLFYLKREWLLFLGLLLLLACDIFVGLMYGAGSLLNLSSAFMEILYKYNLAFLCYIPAEFLIALSSVWARKKKS